MEKFRYIERNLYANLVGKHRRQTLNLLTQIFRDRNLGAESFKIVYTREWSLIETSTTPDDSILFFCL